MAIVDVVKYNGSPDVFAWKYPHEELGTWTQLIVNETQEAILFKGGQALDLFPPGRHTLETANIPLLNHIINLPFGGRSPFTAEVWYVNKIHSLDIKWGTPTPIQIQDPKYKIFIPLRSYGQFGIRINDSRQFLTKLVGTLAVLDRGNIVQFFRGLYLTVVKDVISSYLINKGVSVLEINAFLNELSEHLREKMVPILEEYGIKLLNFYVNDINIPEDDPAVTKLKEALAKRAEMEIVGYSYIQERSFDTLEGAARNPSSGQAGLMGAGIGLGMGVGMGGVFGNQIGGIAQNITTKPLKQCPRCHADMEADKRFCSSCGYDSFEADQNSKVSDDQSKCSQCGKLFSKKAKFCPECGKPYIPCAFCGADRKEEAALCKVCGKTPPRPCPQCGAFVENERANFCPECGASLIRKCSACGAKIKGSEKFCPECGNRI